MISDDSHREPASNRVQRLVFIGLSLLVAGLAGISYFLNVGQARMGFRRFLAGLNPLIGVLLVSILGVSLLSRPLSRGWFRIYNTKNLKGLLVSSSLAANFALVMILLESARVVVFPVDINVRFPASLFFYPVMGYFVEIIFHVVPLSLLLSFPTSLSTKLTHKRVIWPCLLTVSLLEPIFQLALGLSGGYSLWANLYGNFLHVYLINLCQLVIFMRYDFVSMYAFRLVYYALWHVAWGYLRLSLLF